MLDKIPSAEEMMTLVGQSLYDVWNKLCTLIDEQLTHNRRSLTETEILDIQNRCEQLYDLCGDQYPVIVGGAHPFREGGHIPELPEEQLARFDFFDLNGKDVAEHRMRTERLTYHLGESLHKPVVGGSDTHQAVQYGCIRTRFEKTCTTVPELYEEMQSGNYEIAISDQAAFQVKTANLLKRALKEIHVLGGDYVALLMGKESEISGNALNFKERKRRNAS